MSIVNKGPEYERILEEYGAALMGFGSAAEAKAAIARRFAEADPPLFHPVLPSGCTVEYKEFKFEHNMVTCKVVLPAYPLQHLVLSPDLLTTFDELTPALQDALDMTEALDRLQDDGCPNA